MKFFSKQFFLHLNLFVVIELMFVLILFRELPETNLFTMMGVLHTSYWFILLGAGFLRERSTTIFQRWCATYIPIVFHVVIHVWVSYQAMIDHDAHDMHDKHSMIWIMIGAIVLGMLIYIGEYILHRKLHCDTHHAAAHKHCHDGECERKH